MPIYEFHCKACRNEFKTLRAADGLADVKCPTCGTEKVARLLSVTAQLRATGGDACGMPMGAGCCLNNPDACGCRN